MDSQLSKISPVERHIPAPVVLIQLLVSSAPQLHALNRMSRPQFASAAPMRLYRMCPGT